MTDISPTPCESIVDPLVELARWPRRRNRRASTLVTSADPKYRQAMAAIATLGSRHGLPGAVLQQPRLRFVSSGRTDSVRHQGRKGHRGKDTPGHAPENELP